ncbi:hypothetical protein SDC9_51055 [bioreactor metagenome]|uniref:Uncharacterized protein n=1 Tax=bioreactor metagenome TaxID=1076179 RepID=A0A644WLL9_9ZZZZ
MLKKKTSKWEINEDTKGLLFFAQRLDEALFDYTAEKYKASVLYTANSCFEVLETIQQIKEDIWPIKTLETVYEEFKQIFKHDDTAKSLIGDIASYYLINIEEKKLDNLKANLELFYFKIRPVNYLTRVKEQLIEEIEGNKRSIVIEQLTLRLISVLTHIGYSQDYIYYETNQFFFRDREIKHTDSLKEFLDIFKLKVHKYDVYFKASKLFIKIKDACKGFNAEIVTEKVLSSNNYKKLKIGTHDCLIKVSNIKVFDHHIAKTYAHKTLAKIGDLFTFFHHKQRLDWGEFVVVYNHDSKEEMFLNNNSSPMHKGVDYYPKKAAERLDSMLRKLDLHKESFFRFNRSVDFHGTSIDNNYPENQLLQNWIALETLIVDNKDDSKINQLISSLIPILNFEYIKDIFVALVTDIERLRRKEVLDIINEVDIGTELHEKLAALVTIKRFLPLAQKLFEACDDFPLLNYRIFWLNKLLSDSNKVEKFIKNHTQRVEWHIRRIYRARNLIVHTGKVPNSIERLVESSHSYFDTFVNIIMNLSIDRKQIRTIDHGIREIKIRNKMHLDSLRALSGEECNDENYLTILWGQK